MGLVIQDYSWLMGSRLGWNDCGRHDEDFRCWTGDDGVGEMSNLNEQSLLKMKFLYHEELFEDFEFFLFIFSVLFCVTYATFTHEKGLIASHCPCSANKYY